MMATIDFEQTPDRVPADIREICAQHGMKFGYAALGGYMTVWPIDERAETEIIFEACRAIMEHYTWVGSVDVNTVTYFVGGDWQKRADIEYSRALRQLRAKYPQAQKGA